MSTLLEYEAGTNRYVGEHVIVDARSFNAAEREMVAHARLTPEAARLLLLQEILWKYDHRAIAR